ncbi:MAG: dihydrodipicolinate synthase family protein [Verrucomicrobiae bacterium]|nr:dihydrodipicolinate synthase family protein [Verrucomicrobiae bacterium]
MKHAHITGLIAAPFTPFHPDGSLDTGPVGRLATKLIADGVAGAFVCGTTGEGPSMSTAERMELAAAWTDAARDRFRIIVQVGHASIADARALAAHAQSIGAAAIGCLAPYFLKPKSVEDLVAFCDPIAAAAPDLPFYFYHLPSITGVHLPMADFLASAAGKIPNLAGIKYTHEDMLDFSACLRADGGRYDILFGRDEMLLAGLALGARGAIGSTYNYMAPLYHRLMEAFARGDIASARVAQAQAADIIAAMLRHGGLPAGKAMMAIAGIDCGPVRPPLRDPGATQRESLRRDLEPLGFPIQT